ncbi:DUF4248 domain-containing protein [Bacteroides sp. 224]|uniref:DUF4248 domain-containing protein n=1 Tax=Bacteroides sp. 224 TaxID=2302936 RepID=UPI0013D394E7|nr:DUF4248 domain-containing protein [Bacteroides sp. 224]NDV63691.1 DUF4248 domain-containing protein [Bacteroides sp. 224]
METKEIRKQAMANLKKGIRSFTRTELAAMYLPHLSKSVALKHFNLWLKTNNELQEKLSESGATDRTRRFSPQQVQYIFDTFEEP